MRRLLALALAAAVVGSFLGVVRSRSIEGSETWFKFLFTPQAGYHTASVSCGWHDGACVPGASTGSALDFPGDDADTEWVYFRSFGFSNSYDVQMAAYGMAYNLPGATCKTNYVNIYDTGPNMLGTMYYTHTFLVVGGQIQMYAKTGGTRNQQYFAEMAQWPGTPTVPEEEQENWDCYNLGWWTGVHLHEESDDSASTFRLRGDADCGSGDRYPCVPYSGGPYDPQDWENDWARALCSTNDTDCDDFTNTVEQYLGSDPYDNCPDSSSDDAWPLDINRDRWITVVGDVLNFSGRIGASPGDPNWWQRLDFNADGHITVVGDVLKYAGKIGQTCT
jgi:hypothetical protein